MNFSDLLEGPNDPGIFKVIFLAGGPGSGKTYAANKLGLASYGLRTINSDEAYEYLLQKHDVGMDPASIASAQGQELRGRAKEITSKRKQNYISGRLGIVIDGTAKDPNKIINMKKSLEELGYQAAMVFVNTTLKTAMQRNLKRARSVPNQLLTKSHAQVQAAMPKLQAEFGDLYVEINSDDIMVFHRDIEAGSKIIRSFMSAPLTPTAKQWVNTANLSKATGQDIEQPVKEFKQKPVDRRYKKEWPFDDDIEMIAVEGNKAQLGIPANATLAQLDKIRSDKNKSKETRQRAHWLANMRRGNK